MTVIQPPAMGRAKTGRSTRILCRLVSYAVFFFAFFCAIGLVESLLVPKAIDTGIAVPLGEAFFVDLLVTTAYIFVSIFLEERNLAGDEYRRYRNTASKLIPGRKSA
jgi:protein-S-isoprenylcysteine O-methyltransferase Ste14